MNRGYLKHLRQGGQLSGFLTWSVGDDTHTVPGVIVLEESRQIVIRLILHSWSPIKLGFDAGICVNGRGEEIEATPIPEVCVFQSPGGALTLIQARRSQGFTEVMGNPVEVPIRPRYVIPSHIEPPYWKHPVELRAEIGGLEDWVSSGALGRSISMIRDTESFSSKDKIILEFFDHRAQTFSSRAQGTALRLKINPLSETFRGELGEEIGIRFRFALEVSSQTGKLNWANAQKEIQNFQELLMLMAWKPFAATNLQGRFGQNDNQDKHFWESIGFPAPPKEPLVSDWIDIFNSNFLVSQASSYGRSSNSYIVPFSEFGQSMVDEWGSLRQTKYHAIQLFVQTITTPQMAPEVKALQLGAGIESLGFKLQEENTSTKSADRKSAFQLFSLVGTPVTELFPKTFATWAKDANDIYQAMKHLNRQLPDTGEIARINYLSVLAIQAWLASELGASKSAIKSYLNQRLTSAPTYSQIDDPSEIDAGSDE